MAVVLVPNILMWAAAMIAALWKSSQLVRVPHDKGLRVVTICTILVFVALSAQLAVSIPGIADLFPSQSPKLVQNVLLTFFFALLIVLLQSTLTPTTLASRGYREITLAALASCGLIIAFAATAVEGRGSYNEATGYPGALAFYLIGNVYMSYATARGAYLCWTSAGHIRSGARLSLKVATAGLILCLLGTHLPRVLSTAGRLALNMEPIPGTERWTPPLLAVGIIVFFLGIGYPGARTGLIKARLWVDVRRRYRQLRPLWIALYRQFHNIALFPPRGRVREAFHMRQMRLRYYRRIIECRDGLVCLSPYLAESIGTTHTPEREAELVRDALARSSQGVEIGMASIIAAPEAAGMEADTQQLLALSNAFTRIAGEEGHTVADEISETSV